uniref:Fibroblast growth factor-binding protein 1 n=1 Tax=Oryzias sinensis TaxID=183150 RepID=A0A8C8A5H0_9TELE
MYCAVFMVPHSGGKNKQKRRAQRDGAAIAGSGKFSTADKMQCKWNTRNAGPEVILRVTCEPAGTKIPSRSCEYTAKPQSCLGYQSDPKGFWKQVGRALKRLKGKLCEDERALVKAGMCKSEPRDAHFKLDTRGSPTAAQPREADNFTAPPGLRITSVGPTACAKRADHSKTAEEYCGSSWGSFCAFLFSILLSEDC